jgi:spore maturation protein CgeB
LFVGSNWHDRTSLRYAIEEGFDVAVYGYNWQGIVPDEMYKAPYIENTQLNQYYSSAKIVLNDHRPDMKEKGFINNRIYDVTATGTMVISDYMPEIKEAYGDTIPMYKTKEELKTLLNYYLNNESEREALAKQAQKITLEKFTNHAIAKQMLDAK